MNAKEKAIELIDKFNPYALDSASDKSRSGEYNAKLCALICVDEIIKEFGTYYKIPSKGNKYTSYWLDVKQEIQNL